MVSVVIPDCRDGLYLQRCINSIRRQTYKDIEIIAVWKPEDDAKYLEGVRAIQSEVDTKSLIENIVDESKAECIYFLSYYSVLAPNTVEALLKENEEKKRIVKANEVVVSKDKKYNHKENSLKHFMGLLLEKDVLEKALENYIPTYCDEYQIWNKYINEFEEVLDSEEAFYYSTYVVEDEIEVEDEGLLEYAPDLFHNTLTVISGLEEDNLKECEDRLINKIKIPETELCDVCKMVYEERGNSYNLILFFWDYYRKRYQKACIEKDSRAYEEVKRAMMWVEEPELQFFLQKKLGISADMFSAMKHLDLHNYLFVIEDNALFLSMKYPNGIKDLYGSDLVDYVVSKYERGRLGVGTIIKSIIAWIRYKIKKA